MVKGRDSNQENEGSDALTKGGARKAVSDPIDPTIPMEFDIQGAKLSAVTQATYRGILERKPRNERGAELQKTTYNEYAAKQSLTSQVTWPHPGYFASCLSYSPTFYFSISCDRLGEI